MTRLHTLAFAMALGVMAFAQVKQVPYTSVFYQDENWKVTNVAEGTKTWEDIEFSSREAKKAGYPSGKEYRYDRNSPADDWLIGPPVHLEAGKEYKVSFTQDVDANERFSLCMSQLATIEALSAPESLIYDFEFVEYGWQRVSKVIKPDVTADYYFGFHAYSPEYEDDITITGFEVKENVFCPASPGNFSVTPDINGSIEALLSWELPAKDSDGADLPEGASFQKVEVFRDGTLVQTLPGDAVSFKDTEALGLTAGQHTYGVSVTVNGATSPKTELRSRHIGPLEAFRLPWESGIPALSSDDFETYYAIAKGADSQLPASKGWSFKPGYIQFYPSSFDREDDWLMLPKVNFDKPGIYRLRMDAEYDETSAPLIEVYKGTGKTIADQTEKLTVIDNLPANRSETYVAFEINEAGEYTLALHAARPEGPSGRYMKFYDFAIEETIERPRGISDLNVTTSGNAAQITLVVPALTNVNRPIVQISKIEIYRNGNLAVTLTEGIVPGQPIVCEDIPDTGGIFTYYAIPYAGDVTPDTEPIAVTSPWIGDKTQNTPYEIDFTQDIDTSILSNLWEIRNNDNDDYTWSVKSSGFTLELDDYDGGSADDMLVSPPFNLESGEYEVTLSVKGGERDFPLVVGFMTEGSDAISFPQTLALSGSNSYSDYTAVINLTNESAISMASDGATNRRGNLVIHANGEYGYDLYNITVRKLSLKHSTGTTVGIRDTAVNDSPACRYYSLQGLEISEPRAGGLYIVRCNDGTVRKVIIR